MRLLISYLGKIAAGDFHQVHFVLEQEVHLTCGLQYVPVLLIGPVRVDSGWRYHDELRWRAYSGLALFEDVVQMRL